jgi:hypothetical protein
VTFSLTGVGRHDFDLDMKNSHRSRPF